MNAAFREHPLSLAAAAIQRGAFVEAKAMCARVLAVQPNDPEALFLLANVLTRSSQPIDAIPLLERARTAAPRNVLVLNSLGGAYAETGQLIAAGSALEEAVALDILFPWALQNLVAVYGAQSELAKARAVLERALTAKPDYVEALAALAEVAEKEGEHDEAEALIARVLALPPAQDGAYYPAKRFALFSRARIAEAKGAYDSAYESFAAGNAILRNIEAPHFAQARGAVSPPTVSALSAFVRDAKPARWSKAPDEAGTVPTFLIGFPRSGTTLMEQILASHPDVETLEEHECLADASERLVLQPGGLARWETLSGDEIAALRRAYWARAARALGHAPGKRVFVDRMPLNTILLPLIHRIFPTAKILFAVRDPRDVVMSCFKQNFTLNIGMYQFLSLESSVRYYDSTMALGCAARDRFGLAMHAIRYEELVRDLDGTVAPLLNFLDLPWDDRVRNYQATAKTRSIRTPSAPQVRKPLYTSAIGSWKPYAKQLAPHRAVLDRWAKRFGYAAD